MKLIWQISGQPSSTTGHEGDGETCDKKHEPELVKSPRAESKDVHEADIASLREVDLSPQVHCEEAVSGGINTRLFSGQTGNAAKGRQLRETMARVPSNMEGNVKQGNQSKCGPTNLGSRVAGTDSGRGPLVRGVGKVFCSHSGINAQINAFCSNQFFHDLACKLCFFFMIN